MCSDAEKLAGGEREAPLSWAARVLEWNARPRRQKNILLPQIAQLALEGHSGEMISRRFGVPGRTVRHWLQELRQEWAAAAAGGAAEMLALALARLNMVYRAAMEEWRNTPTEMEVQVMDMTHVADSSHPTITKKSVRTQPQRRNAALLARATAAAKATFDLKLRAVLSQACTAGPESEEALRAATGDLLPALADACEGQCGPDAASMPLATPSNEEAGHAADDGLPAVVASDGAQEAA
jgi:transposase-like protein